MPDRLVLDGIRSLLASCHKREEAERRNGKHEERTFILHAGQHDLSFTREATLLSLRVLPIAMRLDPKLAGDMLEQDATLKQLTENEKIETIERWSGGSAAVTYGAASPDRAKGIQGQSRAQEQLQIVEGLAQSDPEKAITKADEIASPGPRTTALVGLARSIVHSDPGRARSMIFKAESLLGQINDPGERAQALARVAEAWKELGDPRRAARLVDSGLKLATELYEKDRVDSPGRSLIMSPVLAPLVDLAKVATRVDPTDAARRFGSISDPGLRAYLLLIAAAEVLRVVP